VEEAVSTLLGEHNESCAHTGAYLRFQARGSRRALAKNNDYNPAPYKERRNSNRHNSKTQEKAMFADHEFISSVTGDESSSEGHCIETMFRKDGTEYVCKQPFYSVLHPPDQFRHWCSILEAGGDCMHLEFED
jgi:hypothetical protein